MDRERRIYMAGFFDGEGSLGVYKGKDAKFHVLRVSIGQGDSWFARNLLEELKENYGGGISYTNKITTSHPRPILQWWITNEDAARFLQDIRPWIILKAEQIDLAIDWQETKQASFSTDGHFDYFVDQRLRELKKIRVPSVSF